MSTSDYRGLDAWIKARALASHIYRLTALFPRNEWFGLTQQMRRAAISAPCNIAEGQGRRATKDRINFLVIARGSLHELETQALIAGDLEFITEAEAEDVASRTTEVTRLVNGLIRHYAKRIK